MIGAKYFIEFQTFQLMEQKNWVSSACNTLTPSLHSYRDRIDPPSACSHWTIAMANSINAPLLLCLLSFHLQSTQLTFNFYWNKSGQLKIHFNFCLSQTTAALHWQFWLQKIFSIMMAGAKKIIPDWIWTEEQIFVFIVLYHEEWVYPANNK